MKKASVLFLAGALLTVFASGAAAQPADRYDRYDRYDGRPPARRAPVPAPPPRHAVYGQTYFVGHLGIFEPNDDADGLEGFDSGGSFDVGIGSRVSPVLAVEGSFGAYVVDDFGIEVGVVPLTVGARVILPSPVVEPYIGAGAGLYFASIEDDFGFDDSDTTVGGYLSLGVDAWLNPRTALNFEGKYHFAEPEFDGFDVDVGGWTIALGVRVGF